VAHTVEDSGVTLGYRDADSLCTGTPSLAGGGLTPRCQAGAGEHSFVRVTGRLRERTATSIVLSALRKESPMTDLAYDLTIAALQGNGPRVTVAPHMVVAEVRGVGK
jgi:hypothetical protein